VTARPMKKAHVGSILILILAVGGIALGVYLTLLHIWKLLDPNFVSLCEIGQHFDCNTVNSSRYARIAGVPLGIFGAGFYGAMGVLSVMNLFGSRRLERLPQFMFGLSLVAVGVSVILAFISHFLIGAFCLFCMLMWLINLAMAGLTYWMSTGRFRDALRGAVEEIRVCYRSPGCYVAAFVFVGTVWIGGTQFGVYEAKAQDFAAFRIADGLLSGKGPGARYGKVTLPDPNPTPGIQGATYDLDIQGYEPTLGPGNAPVQIVIFSDFECPFCRKAAGMLETLHEEYPRDVLVIFKHYPLDYDCNPYLRRPMHMNACRAAYAAVCAKRQGRFWEMHDIIFDHQKDLSAESLEGYAREVGLDMTAFSSCLEDRSVVLEINDDIEAGKRAKIRGTPSIFINGHRWRGSLDLTVMEKVVERLLEE